MLTAVILCAIQLAGVSGRDLRARAFFDANNVKIGDPLILTIDFLGEAEFKDIHPPALSKAVDKRDWKLDDASAKTGTFRNERGRRLTYRVRPMREGLLWFPSLSFTYEDSSGSQRSVCASAIPVHARGGAQVVVDGMADEQDDNAMPAPPPLVDDFSYGLAGKPAASDDEMFAWRKPLSNPSADAFAAFDWPAGRLNEAICAVKDGNWLRALGVCRRLEWRIGQTPEIEQAMVAAIALRRGTPAVELPVWRQAMRPLLRFAWAGRVGIVLGAAIALSLVFMLLGRAVRAIACMAVLLNVCTAFGARTETVTTNADGSVTRTIRNGNSTYQITTGGTGGISLQHGFGQDPFGSDPFGMFDNFDPFGRRGQSNARKADIAVALSPDKPSVFVGEDFNLVLSVEMPRFVTLADDISLSIEEAASLQQSGRPATLQNPTNIISRMVFPMRATAPIKGPLHFAVEGSYTMRNRGFSLFRTAYPFASGTKTAPFSAKPPPDEGRPDDFGGVVAESVSLFELPDILRVGTNDVVTITYKMRLRGYVPPTWQPRDVAFEWARQAGQSVLEQEIEYRRYFVADGAASTPVLSVSYWDPRAKAYKTATAGGTKLVYMPDR